MIPGEQIAGKDVCRVPPVYYHVREPFHGDVVKMLHLEELLYDPR